VTAGAWRPWPVLILAVALLACTRAPPDRPEWVIDTQLAFLSDDLSSTRAPLPLNQFRLMFPYIAGDLYGSPTTGDFIHPTLGTDYRFRIDLNRTHPALLASLEPTNFSVSYLHVEPADARVARLAPLILQSDGIEQVGRLDWFDPDSRRALLLLYLDRPAAITGSTVSRGRPLRYAIRAPAAGYVWVGLESKGGEDVYAATPKPVRVVLAARPPSG
jgi:hypothetical protein